MTNGELDYKGCMAVKRTERAGIGATPARTRSGARLVVGGIAVGSLILNPLFIAPLIGVAALIVQFKKQKRPHHDPVHTERR